MPEAFVAAAVRTPIGRRNGGLSTIHPVDLGAHVLQQLAARSGIDPATVDDVIFGCVGQIGAQTFNIARSAVLAAGWEESVPGTTIDRQCGSSQQALHFAAQGVMSGTQDLVVAGGVEVMSLIPLGAATVLGVEHGLGDPLESAGFRGRYNGQEFTQFNGASLLARRFEFTREEMDSFALESHRRAIAAWDEGRFDDEVAPIAGVERDEGPRPDTSAEKLASLKSLPGYPELTAGVASQISDGASAVLVASAGAVERYSLKPLARIKGLSVVGSDPIEMLGGPLPATERLLDRAGLSVDEIDLFEVNEAFAPVVMAWSRATGAPLDRTNVNGGAIAIGHPVGATGTRIVSTLVHELVRREAQYGVMAICEGGGTANATLFERV